MKFLQRPVWGSLALTSALAFALAAAPAHAGARDWPKLVGGPQDPLCRKALQVAQLIFRSPAGNPWEGAPSFDERMGEVLLGRQDLSIAPIFTEAPDPANELATLSWQTEPDQGYRLVTMTRPWRDAEVSTAGLLAADVAMPESFSEEALQASNARTKLEGGSYHRPLVLRGERPGKLGVIYLGEPFEFLPTWVVYTPAAGRLREACQLRFRPEVKQATSLLPRPVQRLAKLLRRSIGRDDDSVAVTYLPIARQTIAASQAWANAALRPWAMSGPYNSREEVDAGLALWAQKGTTYRAAYAEILAHYLPAERALAAYYQTQLRMSAPDSQATARRVLDIAFRTYYIFHKPR